eukprot:gene32287-17341_t
MAGSPERVLMQRKCRAQEPSSFGPMRLDPPEHPGSPAPPAARCDRGALRPSHTICG